MAHRELLKAWQADPTNPAMYDRDKVLDYILSNGRKCTIDGCINELVNEARLELADEKEQQRIRDEEDARKRDHMYYNVVVGCVQRGEILILINGAVTEKIPESVYMDSDIITMGKVLLERGKGGQFYHYRGGHGDWTLAELPCLSLPECSLITIRRPTIEDS